MGIEIYQQITSSSRRFHLRTARQEDYRPRRGLGSSLRDAHAGPAPLARQARGLFIRVLGSLLPIHTMVVGIEDLLTLLTDCSFVCLPTIRLKLLEVRDHFLHFTLCQPGGWLISTLGLTNCWKKTDRSVREQTSVRISIKMELKSYVCVCLFVFRMFGSKLLLH